MADKYHYHEIIDRVHIINCMIDDFLVDHTGMTKEMDTMCEQAQRLLSDVSDSAIEEAELLPK